MASGVLILCLGKATKLVEKMMDQAKVYRAKARLDVTSESFDCETPFVGVHVSTPPSPSAVRQVCDRFEGIIQQVPPLTSAVKVNGQPAYKRARANQPLQLAPRPVRVYWIRVHSYEWPVLDFEICCGRGTYVRSVIRDIGNALDAGGCLTSLVRNRVGPFTLEDAWTHARIEERKDTTDFLIDLEKVRKMLAAAANVIPSRPESVETPSYGRPFS